MKDDATLLQAYAHQRSEADFAELVRRHVDLVYGVALRELNGDVHLAQDATQLVFVDLARKADRLAGHRLLAGWLFNSARYAAANLVRGTRRRQAREQAAQLMETMNGPGPADDLDWERVRPVLDEALEELNDRDREAVLLRFLQDRDYAAIGARLALSDNAARMCVDRALDKLHAVLARRGVKSSSAALAAALATKAAVAAPAGLATAVTSAALASGGAAVAATTFMSLTKLQIGIASAIVVAAGGAALRQEQVNARLRADLAALPPAKVAATINQLRERNADLARAAEQAQSLQVSEAEWTRLRAEAVALQDQLELDAQKARQAAAEARQRAVREAVPIGKLDSQPRALSRTAPTYPYELREAKVGGSVLVEFVIDGEGVVRDAKVVRSTHAEFEAPTLTAIAKWTFAPGKMRGKVVNTRVSQVFQYDPTGQAPTRPNWF
ncbi:MAG TPA: TonB family protein [Lacunisphaera sp.]|nr:TonB family protein [Lacunisphaera sp.]